MLSIETRRLKQLIPYTSIFLIFLGVIKLTIYYNAFNIQINHFLEFTEIITAFFNDLIGIGLLFLFITLFDFLFTTKSELKERSGMHNLYLNENNFFKRLKHAWPLIFNWLLVNTVFVITAIILRSFLHTTVHYLAYTLWIIFNLQFLFIMVLFEYKRKYLITYGKRLDASISNIILYFILLTFILVNRTYAEIDTVKTNKKYYKTTFTVGSEKYVSDSSHYYIGQTKNFLFYYNEKEDNTTVFPISDVKSITFQK